jgi:ABC-type nitrate/sulfonate/bicarbonate transport system substrate-binding protein
MRGLAVAVLVLGVVACSASAPARSPAPGAGGAAAAGVPASAPLGPVVLAASENVTPNVFTWLAREHGLFEQNGVQVDLQSINAIAAIKALVAGQLHGVVLGSPEVVAARASGSPLTIVAVFVPSYNQVMMVPPEITAVEQLRGRTVGVITKTSINGVGTVAGLRAFGLETPGDYQLFETGVAGVYAGLANQLMVGNVDAAALEPQLALKLQPLGYRELFDQVAMGTAASSAALTFQTDYLRSNGPAVQKVVETLIQSVAYAKTHREETIALFRKVSKLDDPAELDFVYDRVVQQLLSSTPYPTPEQLTDVIDVLAREHADVRSVDVATLIDRSFVDHALQRPAAASP